MTIEQIDIEFQEIAKKMKPLAERSSFLTRERRILASKQFIAENKITRDDVQMSSGEGMPYMGFIGVFIDWLRAQPKKKRFAEWNHRIYFTSDLLSGLMPDGMPGTIDELPE